MKKDNLKDDSLTALMREACPEPQNDADFTKRVVERIMRDRQEKERMRQYWRRQTGMAQPEIWQRKVAGWLMSPIVAVLAVAVMVFACRHKIFMLLRQYMEGQYILENGVGVPMSMMAPMVYGIFILGVLGGTIALLSNED